MNTVEVALLEADGKSCLGRWGWWVVSLRADQAAKDRRVASVVHAGVDGHKPGSAVGLRNESGSKLAQGGVIGNMAPVAAGSGVEQVEADAPHRDIHAPRGQQGLLVHCTRPEHVLAAPGFPVSLRLPSMTENHRPEPGIDHGIPRMRRSDNPESPVPRPPHLIATERSGCAENSSSTRRNPRSGRGRQGLLRSHGTALGSDPRILEHLFRDGPKGGPQGQVGCRAFLV